LNYRRRAAWYSPDRFVPGSLTYLRCNPINGPYGLEMLEVVTPDAFGELWFEGRSDGLAPWKHVYVVRARVC
jgi:hypothetical protein